MGESVPVDAVILLTLILSTPLLALLAVGSWISCRLARRWKFLPIDKRVWGERPWVIRPAAVVLALYGICYAYGTFIEAHWVQTTRTEIKVADPVLGHDRFR